MAQAPLPPSGPTTAPQTPAVRQVTGPQQTTDQSEQTNVREDEYVF